MRSKLSIVIAGIFYVTTLYADVNPNTGCGLGSMLIDNQNTVAKQVIAVTLNGVGSQTFAISSGTLNCDKPVLLASNEKLEIFVADNMDTLATEIAMGEGESLETLASMLKITDKVSFAQKLKEHFSSIYTDESITSAQLIDDIIKIAG